MALLEVQNLSIGYQTAKGMLQAVEDVSFGVDAGQSLGLVGESGCGKTTIGMALMGLLPKNGSITAGRVLLDGVDMRGLDEEQQRAMRWRDIAMIFQAAMNALNPVQKVGDQIAEAILTHRPELGKDEVYQQVEGLYQLVGLPVGRMRDYPHQYSGGMKQRAVIAMALALNPKVIIADEPTTALDVIVQDQILKETRELQREFNIAIIFISHDISIVSEVCQMIGVMYAGQLVERGTVEEVFRNPLHPYTQALLNSFPALGGPRKALRPIPGEPPLLIGRLSGCRFCDRCPRGEAVCKLQPPELKQFSPSHFVRCDNC
ncbi:MAG: ABC transporter ATP-binding protein [Thermodesulfobacteriota bacterium]